MALDYNHKKVHAEINDKLNEFIDSSIVADHALQPGRSYMGASRLGVSCYRLLQYEFKNESKDEGKGFSGQILRIFQVGHVFEDIAIKWLHSSGFTLLTEDKNGKQFGFTCADGRIAGHVDGIITDAPNGICMKTPALWEMKSMNNRSWKETVKKDLVIAKPIYAAQIALYQAYMEELFPDISKHPALFTAINKDTAELYHELIPFDGDLAQRMSDKAVNIIRANDSGETLPRIASSSDYFECKMCAYHNRCWDPLVEEVNHE